MVNAVQSASGGKEDAFVLELTPDGSAPAFATELGGREPDYAYPIAVDGEGRTPVAGRTASSDFPAESAFQPFGGG